ncbi:hypothetical protein RSM66_002799 [Pseudomonas aeruginosa]|nr:hypothetical protein [Pseudomonas aeruginosa]
MSKDDGGPAFARPAGDYSGTRHGNAAQAGMTLRDYFAAKVLAGRSAIPGTIDPDYEGKIAYQLADAMLAARDA